MGAIPWPQYVAGRRTEDSAVIGVSLYSASDFRDASKRRKKEPFTTHSSSLCLFYIERPRTLHTAATSGGKDDLHVAILTTCCASFLRPCLPGKKKTEGITKRRTRDAADLEMRQPFWECWPSFLHPLCRHSFPVIYRHITGRVCWPLACHARPPSV